MLPLSTSYIGRVRKPKNRIAQIFPPTIAVRMLVVPKYLLNHPETESAVTLLTD